MILEQKYISQVSLEHRKKFAQFFTPDHIAELMVNWVSNNNISTLLEPAFGLGIFSRLILKNNQNIKITGFEIDPNIYQIAKQNFKTFSNVKLLLEDYLFNDWETKYDAILCNPPYMKFHDYQNIKALEEIKKRLGINLTGFSNLYTLFLLKSIYQLKEGGKSAYLIPSEFLNSDYGKFVKEYLLKLKVLRHIIVFDFKQNIFNDALTTSALILLAKDKYEDEIGFSLIENKNQLTDIVKVIENYPNTQQTNSLYAENLDPNVKWRIYYQKQNSDQYNHLIPFNNIAKVVRGIATGANEYFIFNQEKARKYHIDDTFLLPCITKSKDVTLPIFTAEHFEILKKRSANVFLFDAKKDVKKKSNSLYRKRG